MHTSNHSSIITSYYYHYSSLEPHTNGTVKAGAVGAEQKQQQQQ